MDVAEQNEAWRVLIVEDDERLADLTKEYLESNGLVVSVEANGSHAVERIMSEKPDLVVLDLMLPGEDGLSICRKVRPSYNGPILMLTARTDDLDQVLGLEMGADDYMSKPVRPRVLLARIRALLRRINEHMDKAENSASQASGAGDATRLTFNNLVVDSSMREAWLNDESIDLTSAEFDLLWLLSSNAFLRHCAESSMTGKIVQLMCAFHGYAQKLVTTRFILVELKRFAVKVICLLKKRDYLSVEC